MKKIHLLIIVFVLASFYACKSSYDCGCLDDNEIITVLVNEYL